MTAWLEADGHVTVHRGGRGGRNVYGRQMGCPRRPREQRVLRPAARPDPGRRRRPGGRSAFACAPCARPAAGDLTCHTSARIRLSFCVALCRSARRYCARRTFMAPFLARIRELVCPGPRLDQGNCQRHVQHDLDVARGRDIRFQAAHRSGVLGVRVAGHGHISAGPVLPVVQAARARLRRTPGRLNDAELRW